MLRLEKQWYVLSLHCIHVFHVQIITIIGGSQCFACPINMKRLPCISRHVLDPIMCFVNAARLSIQYYSQYCSCCEIACNNIIVIFAGGR